MGKKAISFFHIKTLVQSLCVLSLSYPYHVMTLPVPAKLDESVSYTMNFRNINIVEYIRFVAKISKINFIFNESDLNFPVTLVSDQPVSAKNLFSALAQVLEVNGFTLSDQEGSILITKNQGSSQLAPLNQLQTPLITRIYKIENINLGTLTQIVKSIISKGSLVESLSDTNQLIVTDTGPNLEKLGELIRDLDTSGSNLKLLNYTIKNQNAQKLVKVVKEAISPFQGTSPYVILPLESSNQLLVISTPYLVQQTQTVLSSLDVQDADTSIDTEAGNVFLYTPKFRKAEDIKTALTVMAVSLKTEGPSTKNLVTMINSVKVSAGTNTLIFVGNKNVWAKTQEILGSIDTKESLNTLFIYNIKFADPSALEKMLEDTASQAEAAGDPEGIAQAIDTMKYVPSTNSIVFSGSDSALSQIKSILSTLDQDTKTVSAGSTYAIYQLQNISGDVIISELNNLEPSFRDNDSQNLISAIKQIKWIKSSNSLLLVGSSQVIANLEAIIAKLDSTQSTTSLAQPSQPQGISSQTTFTYYQVQSINGDTLVNKLHKFAQKLPNDTVQDKAIQDSLKSTKFISDTNSIIVQGSPASIAFVVNLAKQLDVGYTPAPAAPGMASAPSPKLTFAYYQVKSAQGKQIVDQLQDFASQLPSNTAQDKAIQESLKSTKYNPGTNSIIIQGSSEVIAFVETLAEKIDLSLIPASADSKDSSLVAQPQITFAYYQVQNTEGQQVVDKLHKFAQSLPSKTSDDVAIHNSLQNAKYIQDTNSIIVQGSPASIAFVVNLAKQLDVGYTPAPAAPGMASSPSPKLTFAYYQVKSAQGKQIVDQLQDFASQLPSKTAQDKAIQESLKSTKYNPGTNSIIIQGSSEVIAFVETLAEKIDLSLIPASADSKDSSFKAQPQITFAYYQVQSTEGQQVVDKLHKFSQSLPSKTSDDVAIQNSLQNAKYIQDTNSIIIQGSAESISFVMNLAKQLDSTFLAPPSVSTDPNKPLLPQVTFAFYQIKGSDGKELIDRLHRLAKTLPVNTTQEKSLQTALKGTKYIPETNSVLIQGSPEAIAFVQNMAQQIDEGFKIPQGSSLEIYSLQNASGTSVVSQLHEMAIHIPDDSKSSDAIKSCLETARYLPETNAVMLTGTPEAISFAKGLVQKMDVAPTTVEGTTFYLYKLQSQPGNKVIEKVQEFVGKLPQNTAADRNIIQSIKNLEWIKNSNAILISGSQSTIDRVSSLIAQYDTTAVRVDNKGDFLIYTPVNVSLDMLQESMEEYAVALKQSGLSDPNLIETINTAKAVPSANHLVFTGNTDSINKVKSILALIDQASPQDHMQKLGQMTFFIYQLKSLSPDQFSSMMRSFAANMHKTGSQDAAVIKSIDNMQYLKETNSFLFTGSQTALEKVAQIANKIDVAKTAPIADSSYEIYTPKYQNGSELLSEICQFAQGLVDSGIKDPSLYDTINNIRWIERSNVLIITGTSDNIVKVQDLLNRFDVPGASKQAQTQVTSGFMVYKLQYHAGTDIQAALNKLSSTFSASSANPNPGLSSAISSIQWIQTTNSLVASGDQESLEKLKTLITEIDVPLKQVFIEVLVIQTNQNNSLNFGLQWFGKGQIKNQLSFGTGNFGGVNPNTGSTNLPNFASPASALSLTNPPSAGSIPLGSQGFDLGVIGDVLFHKGKSFLSLGSLVNALQADADSTVVMNPKIISQDNQNSTIFIGQNIPFIGSQVQNSSANTVTSQNIEYRNVGTNLSITPKMGDDNVVTLEITYNMSSVDQQNYNGGTSGGLNGIQTNQTNMTTRVHVPDKHFVVLSGMLTDTRAHFKTGIPCLGGLPIVGAAFSDNERADQKNNILIFIRPCIVHHMDELKDLTEGQENKYRDMLDLQVLKEEFDQGINLVKEPENE